MHMKTFVFFLLHPTLAFVEFSFHFKIFFFQNYLQSSLFPSPHFLSPFFLPPPFPADLLLSFLKPNLCTVHQNEFIYD